MYLLRQAIHNASSTQNPCTVQPSTRPLHESAPLTDIGTNLDLVAAGHQLDLDTGAGHRVSFLDVSNTSTIPILRTITAHPSSTNAQISASNTAQITRETRARAKAVSDTIHDGLTGTRAALVDDAGPTIPEIPTGIFFERVFPRPAILGHIEDILATLSKGRWGAYSRPMRRWRAFPADPKDAGKVENVVFKSLITIAAAVMKAAATYDGGNTPITRFDQDPNRAPASDWRTSDSKPDGYFILCKPNILSEPHWMDIAATGEYKRSDGETRYLEDDSKKVLWNMHQVLRDDPCRRHTYGFTIENRTMRVWYASRAEILVSAPFDFMEAPTYLVRFFLGLLFADLPELGWDPTMKYHPAVSGLSPYYIFTVRIKDAEGRFEEAQFKTIDLLSNVGAEALRGRGTRVWMVRRWVDGAETGDTMVLKDCWIDSDRTREGDIMAKIVDEADAAEAARAEATIASDTMTGEDTAEADTPTPEQRLKSALLTIHMHGDVYVGDTVDRTFSEDERENIYDPNSWFVFHRTQAKLEKFEKISNAVDKRSGPKGDHRNVWDAIKAESDLRPITYHPKTHYRIIFVEVCKVLHQEDSLKTIIHVLVQICRVLQALHKLGWVHRDISAGNIMFIDHNMQVKLADFEYAKKIGTSKGTCHEIRTGTVDFMSIEVNAMKYYFEPSGNNDTTFRENPNSKELDTMDSGVAEVCVEGPVANSEPDTGQWTRTWSYSPLHDLESVVWLFLYFTLFRDVFLVLKGSPSSDVSVHGVPSSDNTVSPPQGSIPCAPLPAQLPPALQETEEQRISRIDHQFQFAQTLFISRTGRTELFLSKGDLEDHLKKHPLHPALVHKLQRRPGVSISISNNLLALRDAMEKAYRAAEEDIHALSLNRKEAAPESLYATFLRTLWAARMCASQFGSWEVRVRPLSNEYYALKKEGKIQGAYEMLTSRKNAEQKRKADVIEGSPTIDAVQPLPTATRVVKRVRKTAKKRRTAATATKKRKRTDEDDVDAAPKAPRKAARTRREEGSVHDVVPARVTRRSTRIASAAPAATNERAKVPVVVEPGGGGRTLRPRKLTQAVAEPAPSEPRQRVTRSRRK